RHRLLVEAVAGTRRVAEPPHVRRNDSEPVRQRRHDPPPLVPRLRPALEQDDDIAAPPDHVVQAHVSELLGAVLEALHAQTITGARAFLDTDVHLDPASLRAETG